MSNKDYANLGTPPSDGDRNWAAILIGVNWAVFTPALFAVSTRLYSRTFFSRNLGWDDLAMLLTELWNIAGMAFVMCEVDWGLGRHKFYLKPTHYTFFLKYNFLDWNQVIITLYLCKLSICLFLLRISKFDKWRAFLYSVMAILTLSHVPLELLYLLQCRPIQKNWNQTRPGSCFSLLTVEKIIIVQGSFSIVTDVLLAAFPVLLLYHMRLPKRQKILLNLLLGLGVVTALVCICRTVFSYEVKQQDLTWQGIPNALCRMLEINFGIIAACAPMMRTFFIHLKKKIRSQSSESLTSSGTPPSQLQFYTPDQHVPWLKRFAQTFRSKKPHMDMSQPSASSSNRSIPVKSNPNIEKPPPEKVRPAPPPRISSRRIPRVLRVEAYNKPENVTWAKDDSLKRSNSFDLPIQGARNKEYKDEEYGEKPTYGNYRYNQGWT